jgi:hypothetical protein
MPPPFHVSADTWMHVHTHTHNHILWWDILNLILHNTQPLFHQDGTEISAHGLWKTNYLQQKKKKIWYTQHFVEYNTQFMHNVLKMQWICLLPKHIKWILGSHTAHLKISTFIFITPLDIYQQNKKKEEKKTYWQVNRDFLISSAKQSHFLESTFLFSWMRYCALSQLDTSGLEADHPLQHQ